LSLYFAVILRTVLFSWGQKLAYSDLRVFFQTLGYICPVEIKYSAVLLVIWCFQCSGFWCRRSSSQFIIARLATQLEIAAKILSGIHW